MVLLTFVVCITGPVLAAASGSWISLNVSGQSILTDETEPYYSTVPVMVGTPPQEVDMTINTYSSLLAAFAYDCSLCAGSTFFDPSQSSTFGSSNRTWAASSSALTGTYFEDTVGFGSSLTVADTDFVLVNNMALNMTPRLQNGNLGLFVDNSNSTEQSLDYFSHLWETGKLLNPVIGMRFNPENPKLTIGALDPADYEGEINWVQLETPNESWDLLNLFKIDGFKGYNGSFFPYGSSDTLAGLNSVFNNIAIPNNYPYITNVDYRGPVTGAMGTIPQRLDFGYQCNETTPYVALTTVINGVDYQIDSKDNLLHPQSIFSFSGGCNVGIQNATLDGHEPGIVLGLAFLRSVYVAYRFPTDSCPGFYGFAFPAGANRTQAQIAQKPTSTPSSSSQCLSLTAPTSTPTLSAGWANQALSSGTYEVYGRPGEAQVQLLGVDDLPKGVWDQPQLE